MQIHIVYKDIQEESRIMADMTIWLSFSKLLILRIAQLG